MAERTEGLPPQALHSESEAETGAATSAQPVDRNGSTADADFEKAATESEKTAIETPNLSRSESVQVPVEPSKDAPAADAPRRSKGRTALLMGALAMAVFLAALDMTIVTTALPTIASYFQASEADYTWIGSAYLLAAAASTPTWGKISDIFGRKPIVLVANIVFFGGSLICALAINVNMLLGGRVIQGIGGGGLIILVNICISDLFSMRDRGIYFGVIGMVWAVASGVGPVLGGVFTQYVSWRWCFYINLPCDGAAFLVLFLFLDIETPKTPIVAGLKAVDWLGSISIVGGTIMFLFGLEYGGVSYPWSSPTVICLIVFGLVTIGVFFLIEWKVAKYPLIPLHLFSRRSNVAAFLTCFMHGFVFISGSYYLPFYFQAVLGATPLLSGVYLFPFVISLSLVSAITGVFIRKTGQYLPPIWFGMFFMTLGFGLYINFPAYASWPRLIIYQIVAGIGVGTNFQSPLIALQSLVAPRDIASATATFGFMRNLATSISVVIGGVIFQNGVQKRLPTLLAALPANVASRLGTGSVGANSGIVEQLTGDQKAVVDQVYTDSLMTMWIFYTVMGAVGLACSFAIGKNKLSKTHEVTKTGLDVQEEGRRERREEKRVGRENEERRKSALGSPLARGGMSPAGSVKREDV